MLTRGEQVTTACTMCMHADFLQLAPCEVQACLLDFSPIGQSLPTSWICYDFNAETFPSRENARRCVIQDGGSRHLELKNSTFMYANIWRILSTNLHQVQWDFWDLVNECLHTATKISANIGPKNTKLYSSNFWLFSPTEVIKTLQKRSAALTEKKLEVQVQGRHHAL